jgi:mannose-6-phosphate isomerase class I
MTQAFRKTTQLLAPASRIKPARGYNIYPACPLSPGRISVGFGELAARLAPHQRIVIDGTTGTLWQDFRERLTCAMTEIGITAEWIDVGEALRPESEIDRLLSPFLGGDDPLFGRRSTLSILDFFIQEKVQPLRDCAASTKRIIVYGTGAAQMAKGYLVYVDVPKNEIQFRSRAGVNCNLGSTRPLDSKAAYKRFYFVDLPVLRGHQRVLLPQLDLFVDAQRPEEPAFMSGNELRRALDRAAHSWFRVRPWFEPGPWGGQWMKKHINGLSPVAPNLAWSFELISPENGLAFESGGRLLEVAFDFLMFQSNRDVLGDFAGRFGFEFPIRFDYLDTFDGGNLSLQCHPRPEYAYRHFGERFTQDETYYISDCRAGAEVFLGFNQGVDPGEFARALRHSHKNSVPLEVDRFIQKYPSRKHGLYLIPNGTIHCSGRNNLVLEISATPYIFTFKMYDWMRLDLDGRPRPLNIERALENLYFDRQGERISREFISHPRTVATGEGSQLLHLPTHTEHFYDVHRYDFTTSVEAFTQGSPHVLNVVEGESVILEIPGFSPQQFAYAETFVVPAAAERYRLLNNSAKPAKIIRADLKASAARVPDYL